MNGWKMFWKRRAALLWALLLSVSLVLGGCGSGDGAVQSIGEEILDSIAADMGESVLESVEEEIGGEIVDSFVEDIPGTAGPEAGLETTDAAKDDQPAESAAESGTEESAEKEELSVEFGEEYSDRDHVALYIHLYGELPPNYITKNEARNLGWDSGKGNLWEIAPGKSIGGDRFGNREGLLPKKEGRSYYECDINYDGGYRGGERIVFSGDGLVYYSEDHYENFELLYDGEGPVE